MLLLHMRSRTPRRAWTAMPTQVAMRRASVSAPAARPSAAPALTQRPIVTGIRAASCPTTVAPRSSTGLARCARAPTTSAAPVPGTGRRRAPREGFSAVVRGSQGMAPTVVESNLVLVAEPAAAGKRDKHHPLHRPRAGATASAPNDRNLCVEVPRTFRSPPASLQAGPRASRVCRRAAPPLHRVRCALSPSR